MLSKKIGMLFTFLDSALLPQLLNGLYGEGGDGMKMTMFEIEASADDLRASRSVAESLTMAIQRVTDAFCGIGETIGEVEQEEDEVTE